jgi:type IV pilus assembly protein PilC
MRNFAYNALDTQGRAVKGTMEADSSQVVAGKLRDRSLVVIDVAESRSGAKSLLGRLAGAKIGKLKLKSMVVFSRQFATMLDAGITILKCLDILENQAKDPVLKNAVGTVKRDVKDGLSLTDAMKKHPNVFGKLYVNMVRAAEAGGMLSEMLDRVSGFLEKELEIRTKIKSAMMYPVMVLVFALLMVNVLLLFVLPRFKEIFLTMDVEMPIATKALFGASDFFKANWFWIFGVAGGAIVALKMAGRTERGRLKIDLFKLKVPLVGDLVQKMSIARFSRTLATLVRSGVPMLRSLEICAETTGNTVIADAVHKTRASIKEGQKISVPLQASGMFPPMVTQMVDVGEETGRLSEMLIKVSDFYDSEVDAAVKGLSSMIEPALIVCLGGLVGFIAVSVMAPIFKLVSSLS